MTEHEIGLCVAALMIAAEQYTKDAALMEKSEQPSLADQFMAQAREARTLAERLEDFGLPHA